MFLSILFPSLPPPVLLLHSSFPFPSFLSSFPLSFSLHLSSFSCQFLCLIICPSFPHFLPFVHFIDPVFLLFRFLLCFLFLCPTLEPCVCVCAFIYLSGLLLLLTAIVTATHCAAGTEIGRFLSCGVMGKQPRGTEEGVGGEERRGGQIQ